jgi:glycerol uptake facilitator-like aquaporin
LPFSKAPTTGTTKDRRIQNRALLAEFVGGNLTGASLNPARSLGPAVFTGEFGYLWLYFAGPLLGAAIAVGVNKMWQDGDSAPPA